MSSWQETTLGKICDAGDGSIQTGPFGSQLHASDYVSVGVPVVMPQNIGENQIVENGIARISEDNVLRLSKYQLKVNDIVYSRRGDVERRAIVKPEQQGWLCGTGCLKVSLGENPVVDPLFLSYLLGTSESREWLVRHAVGATMLNINTKILSNIPLRLPPISQQNAIAAVLGALDEKIAVNGKVSATIDSYLSALFLSFAHSAETIPLSQVASVNPKTRKPEMGGKLRYIDISSVSEGSLEFPEISGWDDAPSRARRDVQPGDTLWSTVRPNRRSHALNLSDDRLLIGSTGLAVLRPTEVGFAFLYEATKTSQFTSYLENVAEGSAYPAVRASRFEDAPLFWPSQDARENFENKAAPLRKLQFGMSKENITLAEIRDALLPQLMSGKLHVKDAEALVESVV